MKKYILNICALLLLIACSAEEKSGETFVGDFPYVIQLEGDRVLDNVIGILSIKKIDSLIVVSKSSEPLIQVYDSNEALVSSFGKIGRGPNEFSEPFFIEDAVQEDSVLKIFVLDRPLLKLNTVNLTASIHHHKTIINMEYEFPNALRGTRDLFYVNEKKLIGIYDDHYYKRLDERRGGFYYNIKSESFQTFLLHNLEITPYEVMPANNINARIGAISPDRKKFATILVYSPILEILKIGSTESKKHILDPDPPADIFKLEAYKEDKLTEYFIYLDAGNRYIYLLYSGKLYSDTPQETRIKVLTWQGMPVREYLIPKKYGLTMFVVDEKNKNFYGISYANDAIYKFDYGNN